MSEAKAADAGPSSTAVADALAMPASQSPYEAAKFSLVLARVVVGGMFIYLAVKKLGAEPGDFVKVLKEYGLLPLDPPHLINGISVILPWFELIIGLALVTGVYLRGAAMSIAVLLFVFTTAIAWRALNWPAFVSGAISFDQIKFDCGCGAGVIVVWEKLVENMFLFFINLPVLIAALRSGGARGVPPLGQHSSRVDSVNTAAG